KIQVLVSVRTCWFDSSHPHYNGPVNPQKGLTGSLFGWAVTQGRWRARSWSPVPQGQQTHSARRDKGERVWFGNGRQQIGVAHRNDRPKLAVGIIDEGANNLPEIVDVLGVHQRQAGHWIIEQIGQAQGLFIG